MIDGIFYLQMPRWRVADDPSECYRDRRNYVPRFQDRRSLSPETSWSRKEHFKEVHRGYRTEGNEFRFASHKRERSEQSRHYSDYDDYSETYRKRRTDFHDYDRDSRVSLRDRNNDCYYEKSNEGHSSREQQFSTKDYSYRTRKENSEFKRCKSDFNRHKEDYSSSSVAKDEVGFRNDREIPNPLHSVDQKSSERISHKIPDERLNVNIKGNMAELRKQEVVFDNSKPNRVSEDLIKIQPLKQSAALQKKELTLVKDFQMPPSPNLRGNMRSEEHSSELVKKNENAQNISTSDSVFIPKKKQSVLGIGKWRRVENDQSKAEPPSALHSASKGSGSIDHSVQDDGTHPSKGNDVTSFVHMSSSRLKEHRLTSTSPQREHRLTIEISQKEHRLTNEFPQKDCHNSNASLAGYRNNFNDTLKSDYISLSQVSDLEKKDMSHIDEADHVAGCEKSRSTPVEICSFLKSIEDQTEENACILQNNTDNSSLFAFKDLLRSPQSEYGYFFEPRVLPVLLKDTPV